MRKLLIGVGLICLLTFMAACGGSSSIFSDVQVVSVLGGIGTMGRVTVDRDALTDRYLFDFFNSYIDESGHNWFTIDFEDGTGLVFTGSGNMFNHAVLDDEGTSLSNQGLRGHIFDDNIVYSTFGEDDYVDGQYIVYIDSESTRAYSTERVDGELVNTAVETSPLLLQLSR